MKPRRENRLGQGRKIKGLLVLKNNEGVFTGRLKEQAVIVNDFRDQGFTSSIDSEFVST